MSLRIRQLTVADVDVMRALLQTFGKALMKSIRIAATSQMLPILSDCSMVTLSLPLQRWKAMRLSVASQPTN